MIGYSNGKISTGWLSKKPTTNELKRLTVDQLLLIARRRRGFKKVLLDFLTNIELK